jgi:hypothetical protein
MLAPIDYLQNGVYQSTGSTVGPDDLQVKDYDRVVPSLKGPDDAQKRPAHRRSFDAH